MSVVASAFDASAKKPLSEDGEQGGCSRKTRIVFFFIGGVALAAALTGAVAIATSILYKSAQHEDGFVKYEYLGSSHAASVGTLDFQEDNGGIGHEQLYINDVTREQTIHVAHPHYDIFILKKFNEGREMFVVTTRPEDGKPRRVMECEETNMTDTEFIPAAAIVNQKLTQPVEVTVTKMFQETKQPVKLAFKTCDEIPPAMFKEQECSLGTDSPASVVRTKRNAYWKSSEKKLKYGNWGGSWKDRRGPFPRCCDGCNARKQCSARTCNPPLDALDQACMDYAFCTSCWKQTPTEEIPHCDCVRDFMNDVNSLRCPYDNYENCYRYRSSLRGIMTNHQCWGRLVTKYYKIYHCGYKQSKCRRGRCRIQPEYCVEGKTRVRNNFKCANYIMCKESIRQFGDSRSLVMNKKY